MATAGGMSLSDPGSVPISRAIRDAERRHAVRAYHTDVTDTIPAAVLDGTFDVSSLKTPQDVRAFKNQLADYKQWLQEKRCLLDTAARQRPAFITAIQRNLDYQETVIPVLESKMKKTKELLATLATLKDAEASGRALELQVAKPAATTPVPYTPRASSSAATDASSIMLLTAADDEEEDGSGTEGGAKRQKREAGDGDDDGGREDLVWNPVAFAYVPRSMVGSETAEEDWRDN